MTPDGDRSPEGARRRCASLHYRRRHRRHRNSRCTRSSAHTPHARARRRRRTKISVGGQRGESTSGGGGERARSRRRSFTCAHAARRPQLAVRAPHSPPPLVTVQSERDQTKKKTGRSMEKRETTSVESCDSAVCSARQMQTENSTFFAMF